MYSHQDSLLAIKKWRIIGPFSNRINDTVNHVADNEVLAERLFLHEGQSNLDITYFDKFLLPGYTQKDIFYEQIKDFVDLNEVFGIRKAFSTFCISTIYTEKDEYVALLSGVDNRIKVWVNNRLCIKEQAKNITKDQFVSFVHLKSGSNEIIVEVTNDADVTNFHLDVGTIAYAKKYKLGMNYYSIADKYLISNDSLKLHINYRNPSRANQKVIFFIKNITGEVLVHDSLPDLDKWDVSLKNLPEGIFELSLNADGEIYRQNIIHGNFKKIVSDLVEGLKKSLNTDRDTILANALYRRFSYLTDFGKRNGFDEGLERKMANIGWQLAGLLDTQKKYRASGLHLGAYRSVIDGLVNNYMVYIPPHRSDENIPLVVIMPWVAKQEPFIESWHMAFTDRIEYLEKLANKYGFAILWESARIYEKYNLNPIVSEAAFETLDQVETLYPFDRAKIYMYGTCSGGLQALLIANRYPTRFAAVGVEGPEINYVEEDKEEYGIPKAWIHKNNLLMNALNYVNSPVYIYSSGRDWHATPKNLLQQLVDSIKHAGGKAFLNDMNNATRDYYHKMVPDNYITDQLFAFFKDKELKEPIRVAYATWQLKYNRSFWISLNEIYDNRLAKIRAKVLNRNEIEVQTSNIRSFTIDIERLKHLINSKALTVRVNNKTYHYDTKSGSKLLISNFEEEQASKRNAPKKTHETEGPINDLFAGRFILVKGFAGNKNAQINLDTAVSKFIENWKYNFFGACRVKNFGSINKQDIETSNLIIVGDVPFKSVMGNILKALPYHVANKQLFISGRSFKGNVLNYSFIYPNPLNKEKYILIINGTNGDFLAEQLEDVALKGWFDYQVWDGTSGKEIGNGYFNKYWQ